MNIPQVILIGLSVVSFGFHVFVEWLNIHAIQENVPDVARPYFDREQYLKAQKYLRTNSQFETVNATASLVVFLFFLGLGGFEFVDQWARGFGFGVILTGLLFFAALGLGSMILNLPFEIYHTFVIEKKFEFNKMTPKTFILDRVKGLLLAVLLGAPVVSLLLWFFDSMGSVAWLYAWGFLVFFQLVMMYLGPVVIMPLFNKFEPLAEGELKSKIEEFAKRHGFQLEGIFTMDGSKRSSKANAFFTGFGKNRRVVLFDTLISKHTTDELVAILAHEIGHYQLKHIIRQLNLSIVSMGLMFFMMSLFLREPLIFQAFGLSTLSTYAGLMFFGVVYSPVSAVLGLASTALSRKYEFEADQYAAEKTGHPQDLARALMKLSSDSLSNLTPHPLKVFLEYTHPPVLDRVARLMR